MTIPRSLLNKVFPRLNISKINIDGQEEKIDISIEIEILSNKTKKESKYINNGYGIYATDDSISSIGSLQRLFEVSVRNKDIVDITDSTKIQEKIVKEGNRELLSKTYSTRLQDFFLEKKNIIIFHGSWIIQPDTGVYNFSTVNTEILIEDGKVKSESYLYYLQGTEELWNGKILRSSDGLTYTTDETPSRQLERYTVKNYKVQDFRIRQKINKNIADYQELNNKLLNAKSRQIVSQESNKLQYFTDLYLCQKKNVSLMFGVNFRDMVIANSLLGKDPSLSSDLVVDLIRESKIVNLKVVRKKVKEVEGYNNPLTDIRKTIKDREGKYAQEVCSGKDTNGQFVGDDKIEEKNIPFQVMKNKMRFFSCIDDKQFNPGPSVYQYGVQVEIMDGSYSIIRKDLKELQESIKILEEYYNSIDLFTNKDLNIVVFEESEIEEHVVSYVNKLAKYYRIQDELEIINQLTAQLSPINLSPDSLNNFIYLQKNFVSNLENMFGSSLNSFDDPHIIDEQEETTGTKNTFLINHYFDNHIYDLSLENIKKVEYLPENSNIYFNEFEFSNLLFSNRKTITKTSGGSPISTKVTPLTLSYQAARKDILGIEIREYERDGLINLDKLIRQNLSKHISIEIDKNYLKETTSKQQNREEKEDDIYQEDLATLYKYFSSTNVENKEIDEVFDLYETYKDDFLGRIEFLKDFNSLTGQERWLDLSELYKETIQNESASIICRIRTLANDYKNSTWKLSKNLKTIDMFFVLRIQDVQDFQNSYSKFFETETVPTVTRSRESTGRISPPKDKNEESKISLKNPQPESSGGNSARKTRAERIRNSIRNQLLND